MICFQTKRSPPSIRRLFKLDDGIIDMLNIYSKDDIGIMLLIIAESQYPGITIYDNIWERRDSYAYRSLPMQFTHQLYIEIKELLLMSDTRIDVLSIDYYKDVIILNMHLGE